MLHRVKRNIPRLLRFGIVGILGATINFAVYTSVMEFTSVGINISAIAAFGVAVINNYIINHRWTFAIENDSNQINGSQFIYYVLGNIVGLLINLIVLNIIVNFLGVRFHFIGQFFGIACGMIFNFVFSKKIVFTHRGIVR